MSQFATTMFNAAFFAGLDFGEYQAHSEHFDRYPCGREATMGFPHPDLPWKNDTPYGILIWTSYTDTSVTVTLYSTQYAYGEQTGQTDRPLGQLHHRHHHAHHPPTRDGHTATDTVRARYRDPGTHAPADRRRHASATTGLARCDPGHGTSAGRPDGEATRWPTCGSSTG